jgi:hypothetical protein
MNKAKGDFTMKRVKLTTGTKVMLVVFFSLLIGSGGMTMADTVSINPNKDNTLYEKCFLFPVLLTFLLVGTSQAAAKESVIAKENTKEILTKASPLQIPFIENKGQIKNQKVKYYAKTMGGTVFLPTESGNFVTVAHATDDTTVNTHPPGGIFLTVSE